MSRLIFGTDEAGRGAVVGPLCIAGVVIDEDKSNKLKRIGVKDSKKLSRTKREGLENKIKEIAKDFAVLKISAETIDNEMKRKSLNRIESERMAELINALQPEVAIIDATEAKTEKVEREMLPLLNKKIRTKTDLKAENHADENYPVVSAASILAKVVRDNSVKNIEEQLGEDIGNGYPSSQETKKFLKGAVDKGKSLPSCIRRSWITVDELLKERDQNNLSKFCEPEKDS